MTDTLYEEPPTMRNGDISITSYKFYEVVDIGKRSIIIYDNGDLFDVIHNNPYHDNNKKK